MTEQTPFSINNVRVNLSDIPASFSKNLKSFLTRQPDFNKAIHELAERQQKVLLMIEQQISQIKTDNENLTLTLQSLSRENEGLRKELSLMGETLKAVQKPEINITKQGE